MISRFVQKGIVENLTTTQQQVGLRKGGADSAESPTEINLIHIIDADMFAELSITIHNLII